MGIPRELRDKIYHNLLVKDNGPEPADGLDPDNDFSLNIFLISRQVRDEAMTRLRYGNMFLSIWGKNCTADEFCTLVKDILGVADPPLRPSNTLIFMKGLISFQLVLEKKSSTNVGEASSSVSFLFSKHTWAHICMNLWRKAESFSSMNLTIGNHPRIKARQLRKIILEPFNLIRNMETLVVTTRKISGFLTIDLPSSKPLRTAEGANNLVLAHRAKGDRLMALAKYADAILAYEVGITAVQILTERVYPSQVPLVVSNLFSGNLQDVARLNCKAINKLVQSRRDPLTKSIRGVPLQQLQRAVKLGVMSLGWAGILEPQRANGHFYRGVAHKNLGDFWGEHGVEHRHYEEAAKDMFFALQLLPGNETVTSALAEVDKLLQREKTTEVHAPLARLELAGETMGWEGDEETLGEMGQQYCEHNFVETTTVSP